MAQRKAVAHRESDLQPVYDFLDALHPARLRAQWNKIGRRSQWMIIISLASLALVWVILNMTLMTIRHVRATTGPFLFEALQAPYDLSARPLPADDALTILPAAAGDYVLQIENLLIVAPGIEMPVKETETAEGEVVPVYAAANFVIGQCLLNAVQPDTEMPCTGSAPVYLTSGTYSSGGALLDTAAARFDSAETAREAMKALHRFSGEAEAIGNYALGVGTVDFIYSSSGGRYTFTWSHDAWVYAISSTAFGDLEKLVQALPY